MSRALVAASVVMMAAPAMAANKRGKCLLTYEGKTYINGPCFIEKDRTGPFPGSFRINVGEKGKAGTYFVYFNILDDNTIRATWNGAEANPDVLHADSDLGDGWKKKGACWVGDKSKICTWAR